MRIGACAHFNKIDEMPGKLNLLKENGFTSCQLVCWDMNCFTDEHAQALKDLLAAYGVTPSAFWCGWGGPKCGISTTVSSP